MKILFIYNRKFNPITGGIERVTDLLCKEFLRRGHEVAYLNNPGTDNGPEYDYPAPIYYFPYPQRCGPIEEQSNIDFYNCFLAEHRFDIVINQEAHNYAPVVTHTRPAGERTVAVLHGNPHLFKRLWRFYVQRYWRRPIRLLKELKWLHDKIVQLSMAYDAVIPAVDAFCMLSMNFMPELKRLYDGPTGNVTAIPNPNTYPMQGNIDLTKKKKEIIYVGRIDDVQKRVDRVVKIWSKIYRDFPDWHLTIIGDGTRADQLKQAASKMERIELVGWRDPKPYYERASVLCLTSENEGWGMVLTEAMTFGTVPVTFDCALSTSEVLDGGRAGMLIGNYSMRQFERKLRQLMTDTSLRHQMARHGLRHVAQYDIAAVADKWEKLFVRLTAQ